MKKLLTLFAIFLGLGIANAQKMFSLSYAPDKETEDNVYGFPAEFKLSASISEIGEAVVVLEDYKIDQSKGFFNKFGSEKKGKFYPCNSLNDLCNQSKIPISLWVAAVWEYAGKTYISGANQINTHIPQYKNNISPPGEIGYNAVKEGKAKLVGINFKSYSVNKIDAMMNIIYKLKENTK
ncbi:hypothetical protein [Empedobacter sp. GD03797]|uniref:hypothetical protein n=1 Tax=Empedobacter sp. GD03797 TaxID=2975382 RepID=UPI00244C4A03|nr:hypothetical protein [Empedobacter sp. GD03797]MDH1881528.1 hypothetical protein [Empedobacter sp. GD03797]